MIKVNEKTLLNAKSQLITAILYSMKASVTLRDTTTYDYRLISTCDLRKESQKCRATSPYVSWKSLDQNVSYKCSKSGLRPKSL